jgi:hypothetical protein
LVLDDSSLPGGVTKGIAVWLTYIAGTLLFQNVKDSSVTSFGQIWFVMARNLGFGLFLAIPLATLNNFFLFLQNSSPRFQDLAFFS